MTIQIYIVCLLVSSGCILSEEIYDVLILGAGMGGISAATTLVKNGVTNIAILEGTDRIGGRTKSAKLGNYTVELGALWIHGATTLNPLYDLAVKLNLTFSKSNYDAWSVYNETGHDVTEEADELYKTLDHALEEMHSLKNELLKDPVSRSDMTIKGSLLLSGWSPQSAVEQVCDFYANDFEWAFPPGQTSVRHLATQTYELYGHTEMVVYQQGQAGYSAILEDLLHSIPGWENKTYLNTVVNSIEYDSDKVQVNTSRGIFTAKHVIVTFSLGVLQHNMVKFDPELPQWKREAIAGIGNCVHLYLRFPSDQPWFVPPKTEYVLYSSQTQGHYPVWQNFEVFMPGCRILQCSVMNTEADRLMLLSDQEIQTEAMAVLRTMFGSHIPDAEEIAVPRWKTDPMFYGSYSNWPPGYLKSTHDALKTPVGRVYFAGEAYSSQYFGYLHGALISGQEVTNALIGCSQDNTLCETYVAPYLAKGCMYTSAINYDPAAQIDDGSCMILAEPPCTNSAIAGTCRNNFLSLVILIYVTFHLLHADTGESWVYNYLNWQTQWVPVST